MERTADNLQLMLAAELDEVNGVARYADGELRILLGVLHGIHQHLAVEHVHVEVVGTLGEVAVHHGHEVLNTLLGCGAE